MKECHIALLTEFTANTEIIRDRLLMLFKDYPRIKYIQEFQYVQQSEALNAWLAKGYIIPLIIIESNRFSSSADNVAKRIKQEYYDNVGKILLCKPNCLCKTIKMSDYLPFKSGFIEETSYDNCVTSASNILNGYFRAHGI